MRGKGLEAARPRRRRYSSYAGEEGLRDAPNLLLVDEARDLHDFSAPSPGEALVTDVTEFRLPDDARKVYLSPAVDLHDGDVVAFSCGTSPSKALVSEMLAGAVAAIGGGFALLETLGVVTVFSSALDGVIIAFVAYWILYSLLKNTKLAGSGDMTIEEACSVAQ